MDLCVIQARAVESQGDGVSERVDHFTHQHQRRQGLAELPSLRQLFSQQRLSLQSDLNKARYHKANGSIYGGSTQRGHGRAQAAVESQGDGASKSLPLYVPASTVARATLAVPCAPVSPKTNCRLALANCWRVALSVGSQFVFEPETT